MEMYLSRFWVQPITPLEKGILANILVRNKHVFPPQVIRQNRDSSNCPLVSDDVTVCVDVLRVSPRPRPSLAQVLHSLIMAFFAQVQHYGGRGVL